MKTLWLLSTVIVAGSAAAFWLSGVLQSQWNAVSERPIAAPPRETPGVIRVIGYVEPVSEIRKLTFEADGVVERCLVHVGQVIETGEILATLDCRNARAAVGVAEQELAVASAERDKLLSGVHPLQITAAERRLAKHQERVRYAQRQLDRQKKLLERHASTQEESDLARSNLHQAEEELKEATADLNELKTRVRADDRVLVEAKLNRAAANLVAAKERLQNTILKAPIRGTVLEIIKREGEAVRAFDQQPMVVFADLTQLRVRAEVDERFVHLLRAGQEAIVYGRGLGNRRVRASLVFVKPMMGNKTVFSRDAGERKDLDVLQVFVQPEEPLTLPIGLQVEVDIYLSGQPSDPEPFAPLVMTGSEQR
jgi:multidrug resistance efflux pump